MDYKIQICSLLAVGSIEQPPVQEHELMIQKYHQIVRDGYLTRVWADLNAVQAVSILLKRPVFLYVSCKNVRGHYQGGGHLDVHDYDALRQAFKEQVIEGLPAFLLITSPQMPDIRLPLMAFFHGLHFTAVLRRDALANEQLVAPVKPIWLGSIPAIPLQLESLKDFKRKEAERDKKEKTRRKPKP